MVEIGIDFDKLGVSMFPLSIIFLLDFGTVTGYFFVFIVLHYSVTVNF